MSLITRILLAFTIGSIIAAKADVLVAAPPAAQELPAPPKAAFGVVQCGKPVVVWAVLATNEVKRFTNIKIDLAGAKQLMAWLDSAPLTDIYVMPCLVST